MGMMLRRHRSKADEPPKEEIPVTVSSVKKTRKPKDKVVEPVAEEQPEE